MTIRGKIYVVPDPKMKSWDLVVHNTGDQVLGVTSNILTEQDLGQDVGDDTTHGHGLVVDPSRVSWQKFTHGGIYRHWKTRSCHPIDDSCYVRVGLRGAASKEMRLPALEGLPLELDLRDLDWLPGQSPDAATPSLMDSKEVSPMEAYQQGVPNLRSNAANGQAVLNRIASIVANSRPGAIHCEGVAFVRAVCDPKGNLSHWDIRFENRGESPWIGTVSFVEAEKNDGRGLESMAVPHQGSAAVQRIDAGGDYGVVAHPGVRLRLGVRGYAWWELPLPSEGTQAVLIDEFNRDSSAFSDEYFDLVSVENKRNEKLDRVHFFEKERLVNTGLRPIVYRGDAARARSLFDPPNARICVEPPGPDHPAGGWWVEIESTLPAQDQRGPLRLAIALSIASEGCSSNGDPLHVMHFRSRGQTQRCFIDGNTNDAITTPAPAVLTIEARGLGWTASIPLPTGTDIIDTRDARDLWFFQDDAYGRRLLS